ncbi:MAG: carbamoyl phosphate synthase small subunit, partial [Firmicutes bacterium]|nr:carbamoyl phosphate synthase small subunit [Bacillota bacterium]
MEFNRKVVLKDGREFYGKGFGSSGSGVFELVFNTSMVGYQEIISDPTNYNQMVLMTYPLIGNYGMAAGDYESDTPSIGAMIVREYNEEPSNFRSLQTLGE